MSWFVEKLQDAAGLSKEKEQPKRQLMRLNKTKGRNNMTEGVSFEYLQITYAITALI
jgi:hypothetical protein